MGMKEIERDILARGYGGYEELLLSRVEQLKASNAKLREAIKESYILLQINMECNRGKVSAILNKALEED